MREIENALKEISQNTTKEADRIIIEYMRKRGLTLNDLQGNVVMQNVPPRDLEINTIQLNYWYKDELILSVKTELNYKELAVTCNYTIKKGDW
jgi:hypothetical protein